MIHFLTRSDLILWIDANCKHRSICRSLWNGRVELLGGFTQIPPGTDPGWVVRVTTPNNKVWIVAVVQNHINGNLASWVLDEIPWKYYAGKKHGDKSLYNGDFPCTYYSMKEKANEI